MDRGLVVAHIDANGWLANGYYLEGYGVVVECQQFAENGIEGCHSVESWQVALGRQGVKDQLWWLQHCLLLSLRYDVLLPAATPFAVGVACAMA